MAMVMVVCQSLWPWKTFPDTQKRRKKENGKEIVHVCVRWREREMEQKYKEVTTKS